MKITKLLYREDKWTKNCWGRSKDGLPINNFNIVHRDGKEVDPSKFVESYSLYGAIFHLYTGETQPEVFFKLSDAIRKYTGRKVYLAEWNDEKETTFHDIQQVLLLANL